MRPLPQLEVLESVVGPDSVAVVHRLVAFERAAERPRHHETVLHGVTELVRHTGQGVLGRDALVDVPGATPDLTALPDRIRFAPLARGLLRTRPSMAVRAAPRRTAS